MNRPQPSDFDHYMRIVAAVSPAIVDKLLQDIKQDEAVVKGELTRTYNFVNIGPEQMTEIASAISQLSLGILAEAKAQFNDEPSDQEVA